VPHRLDYGFRKSSGSLAMFAAIRRASSLLINFAAAQAAEAIDLDSRGVAWSHVPSFCRHSPRTY
jgi:hypothetical protein